MKPSELDKKLDEILDELGFANKPGSQKGVCIAHAFTTKNLKPLS